jgi:hypothetical protein
VWATSLDHAEPFRRCSRFIASCSTSAMCHVCSASRNWCWVATNFIRETATGNLHRLHRAHVCAAADIGHALRRAQPVPTKTSIVWKPHWFSTSFLAMRLRLCRRSTETRPLTMRLCRRSTEPRGVSSPWLRTAGAGTLAPGRSDPCSQLCRRPLPIMRNPFTGVQDSSHLGAQLRDNVRLRA